jgi:hypothetical protein
VDADWIVLRTVEVDGRNHYEQLGPFTIDHVLQLIDKGKIKFTDFVWRTGYENWVPLGRVDEFENPLESSVQVDLSIYEKPLSENPVAEVKSFKNYKPAQKIKGTDKDEERPQEAAGEDLAKPKWSFARSTKKQEEVVEPKSAPKAEGPPPLPVKKEKSSASSEDTESRAKKREVAQQRWQFVASAVVVFIFLLGGSLFLVFGKKAFFKLQARDKGIVIETISVNKVEKERPRATPSKVPAPPPPPVAAAIVPEKSVGATQTQNKVVEKQKNDSTDDMQLSRMNEKQKAFFFNQERLFLFYSAQKGVKLVGELDKIIKKPSKKKNQRNVQMAAWRKQVQGLLSQVRTESKAEHLFPDLHQRLLAVSVQLDERARDLQTQLLTARGPSKASTLQEIEVEYKKLMVQARDLD